MQCCSRLSHYSKSQIFVQKFNFDQTPNIFTSFSPHIFLTIFLVKSKLTRAKKSKTTTFSRIFHPIKIDNFLGKSKLNFWTKNEDFEQCAQFISKVNHAWKTGNDIKPRIKTVDLWTFMHFWLNILGIPQLYLFFISVWGWIIYDFEST